MALIPDIIAQVHLATTAEGGRSNVISAAQFECLFRLNGEDFFCRLLLDQTGQTLAPGETATIPIKFLSPQLVKPLLRVGGKFELRELRVFAYGKVIEIIDQKS